jgi:hypothetical protein
MNFNDIVYWNGVSYGTAIKLSKHNLKTFNLLLAVLIPVIYPVPVAMFINKYIKDIRVRYEK